MKNECNIVKDLLPLYMENMVSSDTKEFVENHIDSCEECKKELEQLKMDLPFSNDLEEVEEPVNAMKKIEIDINKKRVFTGVISAIIASILVVLAFAHLTTAEYLPYSEVVNMISVEDSNGTVSLSFTGEYELNQQEVGVYDVSIYNTLWNETFGLTKTQTIVINPDGETIKTIYYVSNGDSSDTIIYGEDPMDNGEVVTLPRLVLNGYLMLAALIALALLVILLIVRRKDRIRRMVVFIFFAPASYIISHILVTGLNGRSYSVTRDLSFILILTILIYLFTYLLCKNKSCM